MSRIEPVNKSEADAETVAVIERMEGLWGGDWNLTRVLANAPNMLRAFADFCDGLQGSSLNPADREVLALEMSRRNGCHYCIPAHTMLARAEDVADADIAAILDGRDAADPRCRLIQRATRRICETTGKLEDEELQSFIDQGLSHETLLDMVGDIAYCTVTNFTNRLAQTELDPFLRRVKPAKTENGGAIIPHLSDR